MPVPPPDDVLAADLRRRVVEEVDRRADLLLDVSHRIWAEPETCFEERHAHELLTEVLDSEGLAPTRHAADLETAFMASAGHDGPDVGVLLEYDALPGIGHACGHNVIAAAGLGAGLAAAALADEAGGRVRILGTPAEEGGGGKVFMIEAGLFEGLAAAMMVHPADHDLLRFSSLAVAQMKVDYQGVPSHAASAPHLGRNALDAAVLGYVNVAALRQHILPEERVHGIFTEAGDRPNIVPHHTAAEWFVRSPDGPGLEALQARVVTALQAGADAAGCSMEWRPSAPTFLEMRDDHPLLELFAANSELVGRPLGEPEVVGHVRGSTDMGNVSQVVPSIHPMLAVAPAGVSIHTPEFADHARSVAGDRAVLDGARAMALTVVDTWLAARSQGN
jgi:amidohydrolase